MDPIAELLEALQAALLLRIGTLTDWGNDLLVALLVGQWAFGLIFGYAKGKMELVDIVRYGAMTSVLIVGLGELPVALNNFYDGSESAFMGSLGGLGFNPLHVFSIGVAYGLKLMGNVSMFTMLVMTPLAIFEMILSFLVIIAWGRAALLMLKVLFEAAYSIPLMCLAVAMGGSSWTWGILSNGVGWIGSIWLRLLLMSLGMGVIQDFYRANEPGILAQIFGSPTEVITFGFIALMTPMLLSDLPQSVSQRLLGNWSIPSPWAA